MWIFSRGEWRGVSSQDHALVRGSVRLSRVHLVADVLQGVGEVLVDLLRLVVVFKIWEVLPNLLNQLIEDLNCYLDEKQNKDKKQGINE